MTTDIVSKIKLKRKKIDKFAFKRVFASGALVPREAKRRSRKLGRTEIIRRRRK